MTIPVLIILGALWAAVLVPPLLRAHADSKSTSIGELFNKLGVLNKNNSAMKLKTSTFYFNKDLEFNHISNDASFESDDYSNAVISIDISVFVTSPILHLEKP